MSSSNYYPPAERHPSPHPQRASYVTVASATPQQPPQPPAYPPHTVVSSPPPPVWGRTPQPKPISKPLPKANVGKPTPPTRPVTQRVPFTVSGIADDPDHWYQFIVENPSAEMRQTARNYLFRVLNVTFIDPLRMELHQTSRDSEKHKQLVSFVYEAEFIEEIVSLLLPVDADPYLTQLPQSQKRAVVLCARRWACLNLCLEDDKLAGRYFQAVIRKKIGFPPEQKISGTLQKIRAAPPEEK